MPKFEAPTMSDGDGSVLVAYRDRTSVDDLTDVGWLHGEVKEEAKRNFLATHGQYYENGRRYKA